MRLKGTYDPPPTKPTNDLLPFPRCAACGSEMQNRRRTVCDKACALVRRRQQEAGYRERRRKPVVERECQHCGAAFTTTVATKRFCAPICCQRAAHSTRRAREAGAFVEAIWRSKVYARDGYRCQLCRKPVRMDQPVPHPEAPTLDHVVPLAAGGTHAYANVQLAHFICNSRKSAGGGQLRLSI